MSHSERPTTIFPPWRSRQNPLFVNADEGDSSADATHDLAPASSEHTSSIRRNRRILPISSRIPVDDIASRSRVAGEIGDPWQTYARLGTDGSSTGEVTVALKDGKHFDVRSSTMPVANGNLLRGLRRADSEFIVSLVTVFWNAGAIYFVYDRTNVSLLDVSVGPISPLSEGLVALIAKDVSVGGHVSQLNLTMEQVISGLKWLHETLQIDHGDLSLQNVAIDQGGLAKLRQFGEAQQRRLAMGHDGEALSDLLLGLVRHVVSPAALALAQRAKHDEAEQLLQVRSSRCLALPY